MSSGSGANNGHAKEAALYEQQLSKIGEVRAALGQLSGKSALYCSDGSIARYLIARNWDVKKATKMLTKTLKWRSEYKPDEIRWDDISGEAMTGKIYRSDYFDKSGRSILVMRPGCQNTKKSKGQIRYLVYCMENAILNLPPGQDQMVWLIDFAGFSLPNVSLLVTKLTADVLQGHYPERLAVAILYNAPKFFESFWKMASPLLEPKTKNKVKFVYSDRPETDKIMEDLFNMDELECAFGGRSPATFNINDYAARMREDDKKMPLLWPSTLIYRRHIQVRMRIAALMVLLTLAFLVLASNADTKPSCTVKFLKKFGGYLIGGCQEDCHRILPCPEDKDCNLHPDIVGKRCRCTRCIYSSKAPIDETVMLTS